jgi:hypothetical protein
MGSEVRYVFGDLLTGQVIEEIDCSGVSLGDSLEGGEFRGTFYLDQTGKNNADLAAATLPGKNFVVVERNSVPVWGGLVWSRTYQSQAKVAQLYAKTMDQYPSKRFITDDITFTNVEQRNIFRQLYLNMQADPNSPQIVLPPMAADANLIDYSVAGSELRFYRDAFDELSTTENGFEWHIDIARVAGNYVWTLRMGAPTIGQPLSDSSIIFEYPGPILNYWQNDTIGGAGTNIFGVGAGEGEAMAQVEVVHTGLLSAGFPRYDQSVSLKNVSDQDSLEALTQIQAQVLKAPMPVFTVELKGGRDPDFGDWALGDYSKLVIKDPMHPNGMTHPARILQWDYTPPSADGDEEYRLTFEGEDADDG